MTRVFDCFTFFNELELLELRLNELNSVVDYFVLCEARKTHTNRDKPLHYLENKHRLPFTDKIIHVVLDEFPDELQTNWDREMFQRNALAGGLQQAAPDDIIIVSDVDEIPRASAIMGFVGPVSGLRMKLHYYYLNLLNTSGPVKDSVWSAMTRYRFLQSPQWLRMFARQPHPVNRTIDDAGWHFSYLGGAERIKHKLDSFAHQESDVQKFNSLDHIEAKLAAGEDLFERGYRWEFVEVDGSYPEYVQRNAARFQHLIGTPRAVEPTTSAPAETDGYYDYSRPEVVALVPPSARRVLELGCARGALGQALIQRQDCHVTGVELSPEAATVARTRLDRVLLGDCENLDFAGLFQPGEFDCVVAADVLEHLRDPEQLLQRLRPFLAKDAYLVASIPNVRNAGVLRSAVEGNWTYQDAGILDRTHLRFFTRREIDRLLERSAFAVEACAAVDDPSIQQWAELGRPTSVAFGPLNVTGLPAEEVREFFAIQWLVRAQLKERVMPAKTSIVILTHNQLEYTRQCVESIAEHTRAPYELIFVDNASTDGTLDYLRTVAGAKIVVNAENLGYARGNNQGMVLAEGEYVLLLNNDTVVTPGWLERMLEAMERDPRIGIVGPRSNSVAGAQIIHNVPYDDRASLDDFARRRAEEHAGDGTPSGWVVGFCLLARKQVVEKIGGLDPRYGLGNFEDNDFCLRALLAGWGCWIADDSFVHHYGGRTFAGAGIDYADSVRTNARIFAAKWNMPMDGDALSPVNLTEILERGFDRNLDFVPLPDNVAYTNVTPALAAYHAGVQLLNARDAGGAVERFNAAVAAAPTVADFHNALGAALSELEQHQAAVNALERAAELAPSDEAIRQNLAEARANATVNDFSTLYYNQRQRTWSNTFWLGVPIAKCPLDLWIYQEILHELRPDLIIECGTFAGGSALYLASLCELLGKGRIVSIDIEPRAGRPQHPRVQYLTGSSTDPAVVARVRELIQPGEQVLVILDSDHSARHVLDELRAYSPLVSRGSYVIVEDTNVNGHPVVHDFGPGPMEAVETFLADHSDFRVDAAREKLFLTFNPRGFLRRVA